MLQSFLVYTVTAAVLAWLGWHANAREQRIIAEGGKELPFFGCWEIIVSVLFFAAVAGARFKTGYDHLAYLCQYIYVRDFDGFRRTDYEIGFQFITRLFAMVKAHEFFYFAFWGGLQIGLFYYAFRKKKPLLMWIPIVIMLGGFFVNWMNTIRQVVVECAMVAMIPMCTTIKRTLVCSAIALALLTIHFTAFLVPLFLGLMWLMRDKELSRRTMYIIYGVCVVLGVYPIWLTAFGSLVNLLQGTDYQKYIPLVNDMISNGYRFTPWGPNHTLVVLSQLLLVWFYPQVRKHFEGDDSLHSFFNLSFVGMCLSNLLINTSHFVLRPIEYLTLCQIVVIAYTLKFLFDTKRYVWLGALALCTLTITYIAVVKAVLVPTEINTPFLYNFIFWHS